MRADRERAHAYDAEQDRRHPPSHCHRYAGRTRVDLAGDGRVCVDRLLSLGLRLAGVQLQVSFVEGLQADRLGACERGIVGGRGELPTNKEGVADIDGEADRHYQCDREQQSGDEHRALLAGGSFVFARVWQAALARAAVEADRRADAACHVDEIHNYLNLPTPFEDVLAEARSYRLSLCLAHQHLAQLPRDLREAISANARTKVYFQASRDDAQALEREVRPELSAHDLAHLSLYTAAVRLCNGGQPGRAFTLTTEALPPPIPGRAQAVREAARRHSGVRREEFEAQFAASQRRPVIAAEIKRDPAARAGADDK